jgi:hypothetical protein
MVLDLMAAESWKNRTFNDIEARAVYKASVPSTPESYG